MTKTNTNLILERLRIGPMTRKQLAEMLYLPPRAVQTAVAKLKAADLVQVFPDQGRPYNQVISVTARGMVVRHERQKPSPRYAEAFGLPEDGALSIVESARRIPSFVFDLGRLYA
jgi:DNA-binding MarR family transcriptional regulator